jgi:hypothetical protein
MLPAVLSHDTLTVLRVAAACAAISLTPAAWAWWIVRGSRPALASAALLTTASTAALVAYGGVLTLLITVAAVGIPTLARRHLGSRGRIAAAVVLAIVTVACLLASVVIVWLTDIDVHCPPEASDCL